MLSYRAIVAAVIAFALACVPAYADTLNLQVTVSFNPPAGSSFVDDYLAGSFQFYTPSSEIGGDGSILYTAFDGPLAFSGLATGVSQVLVPEGPPIIPPSPILPLYIALNGFITATPSGPPIFPAFAFASGDSPVATPQGPPIIPIGFLGNGVTSLSASGGIFAFASPGTQVGTWQVTASTPSVPEPSSIVLLFTGLAAVGSVRRSGAS